MMSGMVVSKNQKVSSFKDSKEENMKFSLKRLLPLACAAGLFMACSLTVFAGNLPTLSAETDKVSVSHEDTSTKVKVKVKEWKSSNPFVVKFAVDDSSVAKVELDSQKSDSFKSKIKAKGTGTTVVKVWLDGYSRSCQYIIVDSVYYQKDTEQGYSIRHYGYMTGEKGEAAKIDDFKIVNENGENRLCVYFTLLDKGSGDGSTAVFTAKCEEDDGDSLGKVKVTATGMSEGGSGYKVTFKLPGKTSVIKLVNDDL